MSVQEIREGLTTAGCSVLSSLVDDDQIQTITSAPMTHKAQPLARLLRSAGSETDDRTSQVLHNTERAVKSIRVVGTGTLTSWLDDAVNRACDVKTFENAASALAEIRALGALREAGFQVQPIPRAKTPTADFKATVGGVDLVVEVHQKQMNTPQAQALAALHARPSTPTPGGVAFKEQAVYPAGAPRDGETTAENVASKFAQIKSKAKQASGTGPSVLWLDLQDDDWWVIDRDAVRPVVSWQGQFYSVGLWHALYGGVGTPLFEGHAVERRAIADPPRTMKHPGLFTQSPSWSAAVIAFPRATVLCENPAATTPLPLVLTEQLLNLPWQCFEDAWVNWPPSSRSLHDRTQDAHGMLAALAQKAIYRW